MPDAPRSPDIPRLLDRALLLRCPACGGGDLFLSWFRIRASCRHCGLETERGEQGYVVGAYMFNIMAAELLWAGICLGVVAATWPSPPWDLLLYGGGALMLALPLLGYPFSRTVFLAFDLIFRPPGATGAQDQRTR